MSDEKPTDPNASPAPAAPLTPTVQADTQPAPKTTGEKVAEHLDAHSAKYIATIVISILIALLQAWPTLCPALPFKLDCSKSQAIINVVNPTLQQQLGTGGGSNATIP